jgi:hypothetical protein
MSKTKSDGSTAEYYEIPEGCRELQDLISYLDANAQIGEILRACMRYGKVEHSNKLRDARKIKFYIEAEIERLLKYEPDECEAPGENIPDLVVGEFPVGVAPTNPLPPEVERFESKFLYGTNDFYPIHHFIQAKEDIMGRQVTTDIPNHLHGWLVANCEPTLDINGATVWHILDLWNAWNEVVGVNTRENVTATEKAMRAAEARLHQRPCGIGSPVPEEDEGA